MALALLAGLLVLAPRSEAGVVYPPPQTLSDEGQNAFQPQVAVDPDGRATVVWSRSDGSNARIQSVRLAADGAPGPVQTLSAAGRDAEAPQIAVDPRGHATVVWRRFDGSNWRIQSVHLDADGAPGEVFTLSSSTQDAFEPQVAVDPEGFATVAWRRRDDDSNWRIQTTRLLPTGGLGFPVFTLSGEGQNAFHPHVGVDSEGGATVAWSRFDGSNWRIQATRLADGLLAGFFETLSEAGERAEEPWVAVHPAGHATVIWRRDDGGLAFEGTIQAIRLDADGSVGEIRDLSEEGRNIDAAPPAVDSEGRATVVWRRRDDDSNRWRLQSVRLDAGAVPGQIESFSNPAEDVEEPGVAVESGGRATVAWRNDSRSRLESIRLGADGSRGEIQVVGDASRASS